MSSNHEYQELEDKLKEAIKGEVSFDDDYKALLPQIRRITDRFLLELYFRKTRKISWKPCVSQINSMCPFLPAAEVPAWRANAVIQLLLWISANTTIRSSK